MRLWLIAILSIFLLTACSTGSSGGKLPTGDPYITGTITQIENNRVLVEEQPGQPNQGNKCWFAIQGTSLVLQADGKPATAQVGQKVKAWNEGPILESYPCQTGAKAIVIQ